MKLKLLLILLALFIFSSAMATEIKLKSSTQYLWYEDLFTNDTEKDIAEFLKLNVTKLDKDGKINVMGYGKVSKQLSSGEDVQGKLYYFYLDYKGAIKDHVNVKLGRQPVYLTAVSGIIDGANIEVTNLGPAGITLFGGRNVKFDTKNESTGKGDFLLGTSVYLSLSKSSRLKLSYGVKYDDSDIVRETLGFDFTTTPFRNFSIYGNTKYDVISESTSELLVGIKLSPIKELTIKGEYYESFPTFDTSSIYSVFAVDKYKEKSLKAEYKLNSYYAFNIGYAKEDFNGDKDANLYEVGIIASPIRSLTINANYEKRTGYAGQLSGIRLSADYKSGILLTLFKMELSMI